MADVLVNIQKLQNLDSRVHWFCDKADASSDNKPLVNKPDAGEKLSEITQKCFAIFAYEGQEVQQPKEFLVSGIGKQLGKCEECIGGYYKSKKGFIDRLREDYNDEDVEILVNVFHEHDVERICKGLEDCTLGLQGLAPEARDKSSVSRQSLHAIIEALTSERFLVDASLVQKHLIEPLRLIQTKETLLIAHYVPATIEFLVSDDDALRIWANSSLDHVYSKPTLAEFDFAFRGPLTRQLARGNIYPVDQDFLERLWSGLKKVVDRLDSDLIAHALRALEHDIYKLALDHLHSAAKGGQYIVQTIRSLLETSPKDFWDAMGAINPSTVAEQIFMSPQFIQILQQAEPQELNEYDSPPGVMLSWMQPLLSAVSVGQMPPLCRTMASQLLLKLQKDSLSADTKSACFKQGLLILSQTLENCGKDLGMSDAIGLAVVVDALSVARDLLSELIEVIALPLQDQRRINLGDLCVSTISLALSLECKALYITRSIIRSGQTLTSTYLPLLWRDTEKYLFPGNILLGKAALISLGSFAELDHIMLPKDNKTDKQRIVDFNSMLDQVFGYVERILDRIGAFSPSMLSSLVRTKGTLASIISAMPSTNAKIHEPILELVKSLTGEPFRKEALRRSLDFSHSQALDGVSMAARRLATSQEFGPCPSFLKVCTDFVEALCDSQEGSLRQISAGVDDLRSIKEFWQSSWHCLRMMYDCCESWSLEKVASADILREFVRDVMQLSDTLFSYFAVFDNATTKSGNGSGGNDGSMTKDLLSSPSNAMDGITKFLRLKDEYLLRTSVRLVRMLLSALTKEQMSVSPTTSEFLAQIAIWTDNSDPKKRIGKRTLLERTEIAGIALDLEQNVGRPVVEDARAIASMGITSTDFLSIQDSGPIPVGTKTVGTIPQKKKQSTIDFNTWKSQPVVNKDSKIQERSAVQHAKKSSVTSSRGAVLPDRKVSVKPVQQQKDPALRESFLNERKKAKQEAERRRAEEAAKYKKSLPNSIAGQTSGEGSALSRIGFMGKDHAPKGENMMVSSGSESDDDSDEFDQELFGPSKGKKSSALHDKLPPARPKAPPGPVKKTKVVRSAKDMRARLAPNLTKLWSQILKWDFFHDGNFPPDSGRGDYDVVSSTFRTATDYRKAFESLLLLEAWSSLQKCREEGGLRPFELKISSRITVDALIELSVALDHTQFKSLGVGVGDILILSQSSRPAEDSSTMHCMGRVHKIRHRKGTAELTIQVAQKPNINSWLVQNTSIHAARVDSIVTLEREYGSLVGLEWYDLCQEIVSAQISPLLKYTDEKLAKIGKTYNLNTAQSKAVQSAVDNDAFTLIQGPPGSGKTKTITAIVGALLSDVLKDTGTVAFNGPGSGSMGQRGPSNAPKKLLVCAPSNAAVDELVMRFMAGIKSTTGTFHKPNVVRLGRSDKVNPQVMDRTLDELVDKIINPAGGKSEREVTELEKAINSHKAVDLQVKEMYALFDDAAASGTQTGSDMSHKFEKLKREKQSWSTQIERLRESGNSAVRNADIKKRQVEQKILSEAHIICATLSGSARESFQSLTIDFETVIIDEAAQCIELSALIPLKYGCSKCIMVGDPKQLPPTVLSREAARFQYEQSLFVRMQRQQPNDVHLLDTQYRMHPDISAFPSKAFYGGKLLNGPQMSELRVRPWHNDNLLGPYRFFDVAGKHETDPRTHSLINKFEVQVALELYKRLTATVRGYDFRGKIGVITPYKSQLRLLIDRFTAQFGPDIGKTIEFNTTDAFQGRESEIIIFSCVRASDKGIGFLADIRRMNVGITRAKSSLWVLGSSDSLLRGEYWKAMIEDAQGRGFFCGGNTLDLIRKQPRAVVDAKTMPKVEPLKTNFEKTRSPVEPGSAGSRLSAMMDWTPTEVGRRKSEIQTSAKKESDCKTNTTGLVSEKNNGLGEKTSFGGKEPRKSYEQSWNGSARPRAADGASKSSDLLNDYIKGETGVYSDLSSRESTPSELKRKRSNSPKGGHVSTARPPPRPPPPMRKARNDDAAFVKKRKR